MIIYLLKTTVCSGILWALYKIFLERENMNHFKRFYLLFSLVFSYTIPLFVFTVPQITDPVVANITSAAPVNLPATVIESYKSKLPEIYSYTSILQYLYSAVCLFFLIHLVGVLWVLFQKIGSSKVIRLGNTRLVLVKEDIQPYSFLHYIFVSEAAYNTNRIEEAILDHEMTHVRQKHSLDIIALELLRALCWFNPFVYAYKRAIQLNHEFLADGYVVKRCDDVLSYQYLLLNTISIQSKTLLTSPFNFLIAKKRLIMMTKQTSGLTVGFKLTVILFVLGILAYTFSTRAIAQQKEKPQTQAQPQPAKKVESTTEGVSQEVLDEYKNIIEKYRNKEKSNTPFTFLNIPAVERKRLETIFLSMNTEQQAKQSIGFKQRQLLPRIEPTSAQFESWKEAGKYGIRINGWRKKNSELDKYSHTDFAHFSIDKLYGVARKEAGYIYQVTLITRDSYQAYYDAVIADTSLVIVVMPKAYKQ